MNLKFQVSPDLKAKCVMFILLLLHVHQPVILQFILNRGTFSTHITLKRFFPCVCTNVIFNVTTVRKCFATNVTFKMLFTCMCKNVTFQVSFL